MDARDQMALQQRLAREAQQRAEASRRQAEFNQREQARQRDARDQMARQMRERQAERDRAARQAREQQQTRDRRRRAVQSQSAIPINRGMSHNYPNSAGPLAAPLTSQDSYPYPASSPSSGRWFGFVDEWFDQLIGPPARARKVLGFFALLGLVIGMGYAGSTHQSAILYGFLGAFGGLIFLYLLKLSVKIVLSLAMLGIAGLIVYLLFQMAK